MGYPHVLELAVRVFDARNPRNPLGNQFKENTDFQNLIVQNLIFNSKSIETLFDAFQAINYTCSCFQNHKYTSLT